MDEPCSNRPEAAVSHIAREWKPLADPLCRRAHTRSPIPSRILLAIIEHPAYLVWVEGRGSSAPSLTRGGESLKHCAGGIR